MGGVAVTLVVGFAVVVSVQFSASRMRLGTETPDLPGIDVAGMNPEQLQALLARATNEHCPCACGFTLAECRHKDTTCPLSGPILDGIVKEYRNQERNLGHSQ